MEVSDENKTIARTAAAVFGGKPRVGRYWDPDEVSSVDVLDCADRPQENLVTYATIGLSDTPLIDDGRELDLRVELVGVAPLVAKEYPNALSTAAFCVINSGWFCYPGRIFPGVFARYALSNTLQHALFVSPFLWEGRLVTMELPSKKVAWLQMVPISESEQEFASKNGSERLEDLFEAAQVDVFDLNRDPVV